MYYITRFTHSEELLTAILTTPGPVSLGFLSKTGANVNPAELVVILAFIAEILTEK